MTIKMILNTLLLLSAAYTAHNLTSTDIRKQRIGTLVGACNQPLWLYFAYLSGSWSIAVMVFYYTYKYWKGYISRTLILNKETHNEQYT